jgi:hypothetical protein
MAWSPFGFSMTWTLGRLMPTNADGPTSTSLGGGGMIAGRSLYTANKRGNSVLTPEAKRTCNTRHFISQRLRGWAISASFLEACVCRYSTWTLRGYTFLLLRQDVLWPDRDRTLTPQAQSKPFPFPSGIGIPRLNSTSESTPMRLEQNICNAKI